MEWTQAEKVAVNWTMAENKMTKEVLKAAKGTGSVRTSETGGWKIAWSLMLHRQKK